MVSEECVVECGSDGGGVPYGVLERIFVVRGVSKDKLMYTDQDNDYKGQHLQRERERKRERSKSDIFHITSSGFA